MVSMTGLLWWFDSAINFEFIIGDGCGRDIPLHVEVLLNYVHSSTVAGAYIEINVNGAACGL